MADLTQYQQETYELTVTANMSVDIRGDSTNVVFVHSTNPSLSHLSPPDPDQVVEFDPEVRMRETLGDDGTTYEICIGHGERSVTVTLMDETLFVIGHSDMMFKFGCSDPVMTVAPFSTGMVRNDNIIFVDKRFTRSLRPLNPDQCYDSTLYNVVSASIGCYHLGEKQLFIVEERPDDVTVKAPKGSLIMFHSRTYIEEE